MMETGTEDGIATIQSLPDEILEYVLSLLSPYNDFKSAMLVCKLWYKIMLGVIHHAKANFYKAICENRVEWAYQRGEYGATISERHSHSAAYLDKSIYIFGGCTPTSTTFNDLWRFDLATRQWIRPLALGTYPSPKACASLVPYNDSLILFGGWSHPTPYPLHQAARFFKELHIYSTKTNRWSYVVPHSTAGTLALPPGTAGHAASMVADMMVVFGGSQGLGVSCNDIWVLEIQGMEWRNQETTPNKPHSRYGHSQLVLDNQHILVIGGCGGPNMQFNDIWLLRMNESPWRWQEMVIQNSENGPSQLWCHAACKVEDKVVVLSKSNGRSPKNITPTSPGQQLKFSKVWVPPRDGNGSRCQQAKRGFPDTSESSSQDSSSDAEEGSARSHSYRTAGSQGGLHNAHRQAGPPRRRSDPDHHSSQSKPGPSGIKANRSPNGQSPSDDSTVPVRHGMPSVRPNAMKNRQKQLETLKRYEELFKGLGQANINKQQAGAAEADSSLQTDTIRIQNPMYMHVLDISQAISKGTVQWQPLNDEFMGIPPEETIFYSLIYGRGELVMFGGIQTDLNNMQRGLNVTQQVVSNAVHFIKVQNTLH